MSEAAKSHAAANGAAPAGGTAPAAPDRPEPAPEARPDRPEPELEVLAAGHVPRSAVPTMRFRVAVADRSGLRVQTIALSALITIEPAKRSYDEGERERLVELFGEPERWAATTQSFRWAQVGALVPAFTGRTELDLLVPCSYDLELAPAKYLAGLGGGEVPLRFHFNGSVHYEAAGGRPQVVPLPWDRSVRFAMPHDAWDEMIAEHYPLRSWVPLDRETVERLAARKAARGLPTFEATVAELLDGAAGEGG